MAGTAAIYARISKDKEGRQHGVDRQEALCRELAERLGLSVGAVFVDNDISASTNSTKPRPQYEDMLRRARQGEFSTLLSYSNSRLTRRPREYIDLIDLSTRHGVAIRTVASADVDLSRAEGRALGITVAAWDAAEAERASERVRAALNQRAASGRWHGGTVPYGFTIKNGQPVPNPEEVAVIEEAARRLLSGDTLYSLVQEWNEAGRTTRTGKHWRQTNVRAILTNRSLLGETKAGVQGWEPILDRRTFDRLGRLFTEQSRKVTHSPGVKGGKYSMGGGVTVCGRCGHRLITTSHHGKIGLRCSKQVNGPTACGRLTVPHDALESYVLDLVMRSLAESPRWQQRRSEPDPHTEDLIDRLTEQKADLDEQRKRANDAFIQGWMDEREHDEHARRIRNEAEQIERRLGEALGTTHLADALADGLDWRAWTPMKRRNFLRLAIQRVEVDPWPEGVVVTLNRRRGETDEQLERRRGEHTNDVLTRRVRIVL
ncbi:recombinase family protein [Curtobacterium sp. BH-2-1-1]|uniref:recombinase family protein n=1 Tax=Curtobacterium sp. BH-2-1-1 TaxID=1905847 RepID=UPI0011A1671A|nr:recombinase family protein [Curtobacterium sp. BH-2-1-1]